MPSGPAIPSQSLHSEEQLDQQTCDAGTEGKVNTYPVPVGLRPDCKPNSGTRLGSTALRTGADMEDAANKAAADKTKVANFILSDSLEIKKAVFGKVVSGEKRE